MEPWQEELVNWVATSIVVLFAVWLGHRFERSAEQRRSKERQESSKQLLAQEIAFNMRTVSDWFEPFRALGESPEDHDEKAFRSFVKKRTEVMRSWAIVPSPQLSFEMWRLNSNELSPALSQRETQWTWEFYRDCQTLKDLADRLRRLHDDDRTAQQHAPPDPFFVTGSVQVYREGNFDWLAKQLSPQIETAVHRIQSTSIAKLGWGAKS